MFIHPERSSEQSWRSLTWEANANFNALCFEELAESQDPVSLSDGSSVGYYYVPQKHMAENCTDFSSNHISKVIDWEMS